MIKVANLIALQAIFESSRAKAESVNPLIVVQTKANTENGALFMEFQIENSKGGYYEVAIGKTRHDDFWLACGCRAGLERKNCYHGKIALDAYTAELETPVNPDDAPYLKESKEGKFDKIGGFSV